MAKETLRPPGLPTFTTVEPTITSVEELDDALFRLSYLIHRSAEIEAQCNKTLDMQRDVFRKKKVEQVGRQDVPLADLKDALEVEIALYCKTERDSLLDGKTKSLELRHGTIAWRATLIEIGFKEGETNRTVTARVMKKQGVLEAIKRPLSRLLLMGTLKINVALDLIALRNAVREGEKKGKDLPAGLKVIPTDEKFSILPAEYREVTT